MHFFANSLSLFHNTWPYHDNLLIQNNTILISATGNTVTIIFYWPSFTAMQNTTYKTTAWLTFCLTGRFFWRLLQARPSHPDASKENFLGLLMQDILQARRLSCRTTIIFNSVKVHHPLQAQGQTLWLLKPHTLSRWHTPGLGPWATFIHHLHLSNLPHHWSPQYTTTPICWWHTTVRGSHLK